MKLIGSKLVKSQNNVRSLKVVVKNWMLFTNIVTFTKYTMKQAVNGCHPRLKILVAKGQTFISEGKSLMVLFKVNDDKIWYFSVAMSFKGIKGHV
jgi:hypothetical protein